MKLEENNEVILLGKKIKPKESSEIAKEIIKNFQKKSILNIENIDGKTLTTNLFSNTPHIYMNPTENIRLNRFIKDADKVATVFASGDFAMDSIYNGASSVLGFDINIYQYYVGALKKIAIQKLNYEEYFNFFSNTRSNDFLNPTIYEKKIKPNTYSPTVFAFWDVFFRQRSIDIQTLKNSKIYKLISLGINKSLFDNQTYEMISGASEYNLNQAIAMMSGGIYSKIFNLIEGENGVKSDGSYLENEESYNLAREKAKNMPISFIKADILKLKNILDNQKNNAGFDLIYLSNIPEYLDCNTFITTLNTQLMPLLNEDGKIVYCSQAIDESELVHGSQKDAEDIRSGLLEVNPICLLNTIIKANNIENFSTIKNQYDIETFTEDTLTTDDTRGANDVFVSVYKKKK